MHINRPGRLDMQSITRGKQASGMTLGQMSPGLVSLGRKNSIKSAMMAVPMTPMTVESRAKHSRVVKQLMDD